MSDAEINPSPPRIPTMLGRYEIVCKLGVGGMADVFLAHQPGPFSASKLVVIKQLRPGVLADDQFIHMFADESRIAVRLNHPNVIHTYEVVAEGSEYYLTLEFLDGKSWYQVLNRVTREKLPLDLHVWVLTQVLAGLQYAHELKDFDGTPLGIVHRDVSPSNVFVTYGGEVKLLDFGIAKSASAVASTRDGIIKGKLGYAAPEQCLSQSVDGRADVFAVGVMLWEAIAQRRRSTGETDSGTYQARIQGTEPGIDQVCPDAPKALIEACSKALARAPEERFQSAVEFRQVLEDYLRSTGWMAGTERLGQFMHEHFQEDFVAMRQRIEEHLGSSVRAPSARREFSDQVTEQGPNATRTGSAAFAHASASSASVRVQPASTANHHRARTIGLGLLGVLAVGGGWYRYSSQRQPQAQRTYAASVALPTTPQNVAPQASATSAPAAQPMGQVTVALMAAPTTAMLWLDGRRISNPYRATHGRDAVPHHFTASHPGYQTFERELSFDADVELSVALSAQAAPRRSAKVERDASPTQANPSVSTPRSPQRSTGQGPTSVPQPGEDLRGTNSRSSTRALDETDPYKR